MYKSLEKYPNLSVIIMLACKELEADNISVIVVPESNSIVHSKRLSI